MDRSRVLLSTQKALIGSITKNMQAITIGFNSGTFTLRVYFKNDPVDSEIELLKIITSEVSADCQDFRIFKEEFFISDTDVNKLKCLDSWVYMEHF